jgi:hypothetical protein
MVIPQFAGFGLTRYPRGHLRGDEISNDYRHFAAVGSFLEVSPVEHSARSALSRGNLC